MPDADSETKLRLYMLIVNRYKSLISEKENKSISEIRQRVSPYNDFISALKTRLAGGINHYSYEKHFLQAIQAVLGYLREIHNFEFLLPFWMSFEEMDQLKAAGPMDKAILCAALLRALGSDDCKVYVTKKGNVFVGFKWSKESYIIEPKGSSVLSGADADT